MKGKIIFNGMINRYFTLLAGTFFCVLLAIMGFVTLKAFSRQSGHTGQDMARQAEKS